MRAATKAIPVAMLLSALALAGCSGSSSSAPTDIKIPFKSPAVVKGALPALYTCDGKDISPPLEWGAVPSATKELAFFILGLKPNPTTGKNARPGYAISVEWALAGINPALHKLAAGEIPPGSHLGRTSTGKKRYSICPTRGKSKKYQFAVYAVPAGVAIAPRFTGLTILSLIANPASPTQSKAGGAFVAGYTRR